jgi:hypothetical protein
LSLLSWAVARATKLEKPLSRKLRVERNLRVPMADGVELLADRYVPEEGDGLPVVLIRTPYGRGGKDCRLYGEIFAQRGYQVVVQSCHGTFGSGGTWRPFQTDVEDGVASASATSTVDAANRSASPTASSTSTRTPAPSNQTEHAASRSSSGPPPTASRRATACGFKSRAAPTPATRETSALANPSPRPPPPASPSRTCFTTPSTPRRSQSPSAVATPDPGLTRALVRRNRRRSDQLDPMALERQAQPAHHALHAELLHIEVIQTFPLAEAAAAHRLAETGHEPEGRSS